jgi:hypothetical protein
LQRSSVGGDRQASERKRLVGIRWTLIDGAV